MGGGESGAAELVLRHHRDRPRGAAERGERLQPAGRDASTGIAGHAAPDGPAQHVEDLAVGRHPVAQHPVLAGRAPGGDRGERRGGRGRYHRGDAPVDPFGGRQGGCQPRPGAELLPTETVHHQQDHLPGVPGGDGKPVGSRVAGIRWSEEARDDVGDACRPVVRQDRRSRGRGRGGGDGHHRRL